MRTTINIDDELLADAAELTGIKERSTLVRDGLRALIAQEASKRLILLGGSDSNAKLPPKRRFY